MKENDWLWLMLIISAMAAMFFGIMWWTQPSPVSAAEEPGDVSILITIKDGQATIEGEPAQEGECGDPLVWHWSDWMQQGTGNDYMAVINIQGQENPVQVFAVWSRPPQGAPPEHEGTWRWRVPFADVAIIWQDGNSPSLEDCQEDAQFKIDQTLDLIGTM